MIKTERVYFKIKSLKKESLKSILIVIRAQLLNQKKILMSLSRCYVVKWAHLLKQYFINALL